MAKKPLAKLDANALASWAVLQIDFNDDSALLQSQCNSFEEKDACAMPANADRNLLFALLALQNNFLTREDLLAAFNLWVADKSREIADILAEQQKLEPVVRDLLAALVAVHLNQHDNEPAKSLATLSSIAFVREELARLQDEELTASLGHVGAAWRDQDQFADTLSVGKNTSGGTRFRILRAHARGGLGEVFVARDDELGREVALKEIRLEHSDHPEARKRFVQEAEITGQLEHPGIVPVYGLGTYADGRPFYAMRFIKGDSLKTAIAEFHKDRNPRTRLVGERMVKFRQLLGRFIDVCQAVHYAHSRHVLHRDLKPDNIMLGKYGETLVVDWGLAKPLCEQSESPPETSERALLPRSGSGAETVDGFAIGTPEYMSPEQAAGRLDLLGPATDIYALGATLYCLLTGQAPFNRKEQPDILQMVQRGQFSPPRQINPQLPRALEAVCLKAMARQQLHRYSTADAIARDVEHWLADEPVQAYREPFRLRLRRWMQRHSRLTTAAGVAMVLLPITLGGGLVIARHQKLQADHQRDIASLRSYRTSLAMTQLALDKRDFRAAEQAIAECAQPFRGWEFDYLRNRFDHFIAFSLEPSAEVTALAIHPTRPFVAAATRDGGIEIWHAKTAASLVRLTIPLEKDGQENVIAAALSRDRISSMQFSPNGKLLAVYTAVTGSTLVWDWEQNHLAYQALGQEHNIVSLSGSGSPILAFSPDGNYLATHVSDGVQLLSTSDWKQVWKNTDTATALAFTNDGKQVLTGGSFGYISILNAETGAKERSITGFAFVVIAADEADAARQRAYGHQGGITSIIPLADNLRFATASVDGTVRVWNLKDGNRVGLLQHAGAGVCGLAYSPNGRDLFAISPDGVLQAMGPDNNVPHGSLFCRNFVALACDPRQAILATATQSSVLVWEGDPFIEAQNEFALVADGTPQLIRISPDGSVAAMRIAKEIVVIDMKTRKERFKIPDEWAYALSFSADSKRLVVSGTRVTCYSTETGETFVESNVIHEPKITYGERSTKDETVEKYVKSSTFGHSGEQGLWCESSRVLVCGGYPITVWNESGEQIQSIEVKSDSPVETVTFELRTGKQTPKKTIDYMKYGVSRLWQSPDQSTVVGSVPDGTIRGWDVARGKEVFRWHPPKGQLVEILPNGNLLLKRDGIGWEVWTWGFVRQIGTLKHDGPINCVAVNPRKDRIASGGADGKVTIWDLRTTEPLLTLPHSRQPISSVAFANDGLSVIAVNESGLTRIWDASPK